MNQEIHSLNLVHSMNLVVLILDCCSAMRIKDLCLIFGVVETIIKRVVDEMIILVIEKLARHEFSRIRFPKVNTINEYKDDYNEYINLHGYDYISKYYY